MSTPTLDNKIQTQMPTRQLGRNGPHVSAIGLGTMRMGSADGTSDVKTAHEALTYAADHGMTFWDTADVYGDGEEILGSWFTSNPTRRSSIFLATKFGGRLPSGTSFTSPSSTHPPNTPISSPSYIHHAIQSSLKRLKTTYIDLYYQHRVDPTVPIEAVLLTLAPYLSSGTIRWVGLSECSPDTLRRAKSVEGVGERVVCVQDEFSPFSLDVVVKKDGRDGDERDGESFAEVCEELGVSIVAYSPLGRGMMSGRYRSRSDFVPADIRLRFPRFSEENFAKNLELVDRFQEVAAKYGATTNQIVLAWILASRPTFIPLPGCRTPAHISSNARAALLASTLLSPSDVEALTKICEDAEVAGARYPEGPHLAATKGDCIGLEEWEGEKGESKGE